MPPMEVTNRHNKAVYWPKTGENDYGEPIMGAAILLDVRWETKRTQMVNPVGVLVAVDATVVVDRLIPIGSEMVKTESLSYWLGTGSADSDDEVMEVAAYSEIEDVKGRFTRRVVGLVYKMDTRPT